MTDPSNGFDKELLVMSQVLFTDRFEMGVAESVPIITLREANIHHVIGDS